MAERLHMIACVCMAVSDKELIELCQTKSLSEIIEETGVTTSCGTCCKCVESICYEFGKVQKTD